MPETARPARLWPRFQFARFRAAPRGGRDNGRGLLAGGLLLWLAMYGFLLSRAWVAPFWVSDDAYVYISRAVQMESCFLQDCPALADLEAQLTPFPGDPVVDHLRFITRANHALVYSPLHSALLVVLHQLGLSWETAYLVLSAGIVLLLGVMMARWLAALWGERAAGVALAFLAFQVFARQGLHSGIPSTLSLAIAMGLWTRLARTKGHAPVTLLAGTVLLVLAHPMGRLYAGSAALLSLLLAGRNGWKRACPAVVGVGLIIGFVSLLPRLIERPVLALDYQPFPPGDSLARWLLRNLKEASLILFDWGHRHGWWFLATLVPLGFVIGKESKRVAGRTLLALTPLVLLSLIHVMPAFSGAVFSRVWIPLALVLTGSAAAAVCHLAAIAWATFWPRFSAEPGRPSGSSNPRLLGLLCGVTCVGVFGHSLLIGLPQLLELRQKKDESYQLVFDEQQTGILLSASSPGDRVLYADRVALLFYCCHGAYERGAVFQPGLVGTTQEQTWLDRADLRFAVVKSPIEPDPPTRGSRIDLARLRELVVHLHEPADRIRVFIENGKKPNRLELLSPTESTPIEEVKVPARWSGWITLDGGKLDKALAFRLRLAAAGARCHVAGLTFEDGFCRWPWRQRASLTLVPYHDTQGVRTIKFDPRLLLPERLRCRQLEVLYDGGSSVLLRLDRSPAYAATP